MENEISQIIERLSSLRRSAFRKVAAKLGIQLIHAEIIEYLALCNQYSNTTSAVVEYLGQTKGSISQSLKKIEDKGLIERNISNKDKRSVQLFLTDKGFEYWQEIKNSMPEMEISNLDIRNSFTELLMRVQIKQDRHGFSVCHTCRYNKSIDPTEFLCGLTGEKLNVDQATKICREHEYAT